MAAELIDGKAVAARARERVAGEVRELGDRHGARPGLATVLIGDDPGSAIYVAGKQKACAEVGIEGFDHRLPADVPEDEVVVLLEQLNGDPAVSGILLQLPVPSGLDGPALVEQIDPAKDVDGLTSRSAGLLLQGRPGLRPCTPLGVIELLDAYGVELEGADAVVVGRSLLVGKPMAQLLLERNATVTTCHSRTRELGTVCSRADVLVVAAGRPRMINADHVAEGAVVIDVGIHRTDDGLVGDVDFEAAARRARLITPVPGGVGPMTIAMLLANTVKAARARLEAGQAEPARR
jgi:methylenetetrahydrofolate dehydrogenase (NADP+)/methenyltetrahydrofolate cyclohydrolase